MVVQCAMVPQGYCMSICQICGFSCECCWRKCVCGMSLRPTFVFVDVSMLFK